MKKRILSMIALTLILTFLFVSCGDSSKEGNNVTNDKKYEGKVEESTNNSLGGVNICLHNSVGDDGICKECNEVIFTAGLEFDLNYDELSYSVYSFSGESKSIIIPNKYKNLPVTTIDVEAFCDCAEITDVIIPDSIATIKDEAFFRCTSLNNIVIPDSVVYIGDMAFENTAYFDNQSNWEKDVLYINNYLIKAKESIEGTYEIKPNTKLIAGGAFFDCFNLTNVKIPNTVASICDDAFSGCSNITEIFIPDSVNNIGFTAFYDCTSLESIIVDAKNETYHSTTNCLIETESKTLLLGCKNSIIPNDGSVVVIESYSFYRCKELDTVIIPDTITEIGSSAFYGTGIESITIPSSVVTIGRNAFNGSQLSTIVIADDVKYIGADAFDRCDYFNNESNWENGVLYIGNHLIKAETSLSGAYEIKSGTKTIAREAFYECDNITSIYIPNSVKTIGGYVFEDCSNLSDITFGGTKDEWNSIDKHSIWIGRTGAYNIRCTDGDVTETSEPPIAV